VRMSFQARLGEALPFVVEEVHDLVARGKHGTGYADVGWEVERVALLRQIETSPFFQAVRGGLIVSLCNQKEV
jgi:hypothetical protein